MDKRYQVFISSTYTDLKEERKAIITTLLDAKYIPAGMELFSASNDEQFKYIQKIIDDCDYYILIIAGRYGTINESTGISFTEQEYDYAVSKKIPVLVFPYFDINQIPPEKRDNENRDLLDKFRSKASKNRLCKQWDSIEKLITSVLISLTEEISNNPQLGWIKGSHYDITDLLDQINKLRDEREDKILEISELKSKTTNDLASGLETYKIRGTKFESSGVFSMESSYVKYDVELSWDDIISAVGPYLTTATNNNYFGNNLNKGLNSAYDLHFSDINDDSVQTIIIQLNSLGLTETFVETLKNTPIEYIKLTEYGKSYLYKLKAIKAVSKDE